MINREVRKFKWFPGKSSSRDRRNSKVMTLVSLTSSYLGGTGYLAKTIKRGLFVADYIVKAQIHALQTCSNHMGGIQYYRVKKNQFHPRFIYEKRETSKFLKSRNHIICQKINLIFVTPKSSITFKYLKAFNYVYSDDVNEKLLKLQYANVFKSAMQNEICTNSSSTIRCAENSSHIIDDKSRVCEKRLR